MTRLRLTWALGFLVVSGPLAGACGSSDSDFTPRGDGGPGNGADSGDPGLAIGELPAAYAEAACAAVTSCLGSATDILLGGEDCQASAQRAVEDLLDGAGAALDQGRLRYDGTKITECLDTFRDRGCDYASLAESPVCLAALDGTIALGEDCDFNVECEGTAYCKSTGACPGTCTRAEPEGGACTSDSDCDPELECDEVGGDCFRAAQGGDRCGGGVEPECDSGLFCMGADEDTATAGACRTLNDVLSAAEGAVCNPIEGPLCAPDLHCIILAVTPALGAECRRGVAAGAACNVGFPDPCPAAQYCLAPEGQLVGTCSPRPTTGQACARSSLSEPTDPADICAPETRCDGGTCRSRQPLGGSCADDAVCMSEHCVGGKCALDGACE